MLIDVTDLSPAAFDLFMAMAADPAGCHDADHLSTVERRQVAYALGWDKSMQPAALVAWIQG